MSIGSTYATQTGEPCKCVYKEHQHNDFVLTVFYYLKGNFTSNHELTFFKNTFFFFFSLFSSEGQSLQIKLRRWLFQINTFQEEIIQTETSEYLKSPKSDQMKEKT